ncbi:MAG: hypothetical protein ACRD3M_01045 [Thermoanaerobaculia bacterium]
MRVLGDDLGDVLGKVALVIAGGALLVGLGYGIFVHRRPAVYIPLDLVDFSGRHQAFEAGLLYAQVTQDTRGGPLPGREVVWKVGSTLA